MNKLFTDGLKSAGTQEVGRVESIVTGTLSEGRNIPPIMKKKEKRRKALTRALASQNELHTGYRRSAGGGLGNNFQKNKKSMGGEKGGEANSSLNVSAFGVGERRGGGGFLNNRD